ncbi:MAG: tRNA lysidine(34) synthetase TilS [Ramlibacter sp.]
MAATPTPRPTPASVLPNPALAPLEALRPDLPLAVAFSGGADSTALLHAAAQRWPGQLQAIHVNHGLQAAAASFAVHCRSVCQALDVPLRVVSVDGRPASGESPEDAARKARYAALAQAALAEGATCVLLAQHADDQVETLLLALSRGAGLPGLAAMPVRFERHGMRFERPLLGVGGPALRAWLRTQAIAWIEDPTNADTAFTRNRIRQELLPALEQAFPQFRETFARSARHAAQAQELLAALAQQDIGEVEGGPAISALQRMPRARQANALRHWLRTSHHAAASATQLEELLDQIAACTTRGHQIRIKVADGFVRRVGELLAFDAPL